MDICVIYLCNISLFFPPRCASCVCTTLGSAGSFSAPASALPWWAPGSESPSSCAFFWEIYKMDIWNISMGDIYISNTVIFI
jgi:hypothetical protein